MQPFMTQPTDAHTPETEWPGAPAGDRFWRTIAQLLAACVFAVALYLFVQDWRRIFDLRPVELSLGAYLPENGGWRGAPLQVEAGREVILHVQAHEGVHTFAIAHTDIQSSRALAPGQTESVRFTAPAPGRYVVYCTTWCSPHHWRMRTVLEVTDPADPTRPLHYVQEPQRYAITVDPMTLDMPHPAPVWPEQRPDVAQGRAVWEALAPTVAPTLLLAELGWPALTPAQLFTALGQGDVDELAVVAAWPAAEQWALVAYLFHESTTPAALARGELLYSRSCAECHGEGGAGDGFAASFAPVAVPDLTDLRQGMGASPALYYAKIARGGMGTGMPNWGTIFAEDDLWALTDYLMHFLFDDMSTMEGMDAVP